MALLAIHFPRQLAAHVVVVAVVDMSISFVLKSKLLFMIFIFVLNLYFGFISFAIINSDTSFSSRSVIIHYKMKSVSDWKSIFSFHLPHLFTGNAKGSLYSLLEIPKKECGPLL